MINQSSSYYTIQPGDTLHSLAQLCYQDINKWMMIRQANPTLQSYGRDDSLPVGHQLTLPFIPARTILTGSNDTFISLAKAYYHDTNKWSVIRQANPPLLHYSSNQTLPKGIQVNIP